MQLQPTEEQALIAEAAERWLAAHHRHRARGVEGEPGGWTDHWADFAALGWLGVGLPEAHGGLGGSAVTTGLLTAAMGRHLVAEPFVASIVVAAGLLAERGSPAQRARWLPAVVEGGERLAFAHEEAGIASCWDKRGLIAQPVAGGWRLGGGKLLVEGFAQATALLVSARGPGGTMLFMVDPKAAHLHAKSFDGTPGEPVADLRFEGVHVAADAVLGDGGDATGPLHRALAHGIVAACWGACGAMAMLVERSTAHVTQRRQFGHPLSEFQAVQHRLAEMEVERATAQAASELAALRLDAGETDVVAIANAAKLRVGRAADRVARQAIQLHGAMGVCEELPVGPAFRWLEGFQMRFGRPHVHAGPQGRALLASRRFERSGLFGALA